MREIRLSPTSAVQSMFIQHFGIYMVVWEMCRHSDDHFYNHIYVVMQVF